jgi:hypothetical protein
MERWRIGVQGSRVTHSRVVDAQSHPSDRLNCSSSHPAIYL